MPIQIFCSVSFSSGEEAPGPLGDVWGPRQRQQRDNSESNEEEEEEKEKETAKAEASEGDLPVDLVAFAKSCTLHGASHVFVEGGLGPRQALWAVAFVLALGAFLCQVGDRVAYYLSYPHVTLLDEVATTELAFPAVTLCNTNAVRLSQLSYPDLLYLAPMLGLDESDDPGVPLAPPGPEAFSGEPFNLHRFYNRSCHRLEDMLLYCSYCGGPCGPHNFSVVFTRYGKCYTFNSGRDGRPRLKTMKGGTGNGLEIMLDIQQDEYLPVWGETGMSFSSGATWALLGSIVEPEAELRSFSLPPSISVSRPYLSSTLTYLWLSLLGSVTLQGNQPSFSITYACLFPGDTRYLVENCNCRMVHMPGDAPYCTPEQYKECADPALDFLVEKDQEYCVCEMPCNLTRYGKELSMVKIPSKASAKYLAKKFNKSEQYIGENILVLDIFFEVLNYETIEQKKAYEIAGLLGDIGGQMGLFIGASILTVLELFDYAYEVIKHKLCRRGKCQKEAKRSSADKGVALSLDDVKRHNPCESLRGHPAGMTYAANILPHHPARGTFEDFTC
uniref:Acid sensing ion channel subunit 1 n=1 Tax=Loxodonta africana TaxID=9785 RepID=G3TRH0_LOXAF